MKSNPKYRTIISFGILFVYFLTCFKSIEPFIFYSLNYDFICKNFCENRAKPALKCNGKCFLKKELKKTAKEEKEKKAVSMEFAQVQTVPVFISFLLKPLFLSVEQHLPLFIQPIYLSANPLKITPPPQQELS